MDEAQVRESKINRSKLVWYVTLEGLFSVFLLRIPAWLTGVFMDESPGFLATASSAASRYILKTDVDLKPFFWAALALFALTRLRQPNAKWVGCVWGLVLAVLFILECSLLGLLSLYLFATGGGAP